MQTVAVQVQNLSFLAAERSTIELEDKSQELVF